jgi:hypothetical protein
VSRARLCWIQCDACPNNTRNIEETKYVLVARHIAIRAGYVHIERTGKDYGTACQREGRVNE